jgi:hypothetical protein
MGAKQFTQLRAWQLARQLKVEVDEAILAKPEAQTDRRFCDQLPDAVRSAPRNLAPGGLAAITTESSRTSRALRDRA